MAEQAAAKKLADKAAKEAEKKVKEEAKAVKAAAKVAANGVTRPAAGTKTGKVWEIADGISATLKTPAPRKDVLKAAQENKAADGTPDPINDATAATQYGRWRKYHGLGKEVQPATAPTAPDAAVQTTPPAATPA